MMKLRVLAFALAILAFFIFVGSPFQQSAKAAVLVDDALIAIIIAALAAFGITFTVTDGYFTAYDWVARQIVDSGANFTGINAGVNTLSNLLLNNKFVRELQILALYIVATLGLQDYDNVQLARQEMAVTDELTGNLLYPGVVYGTHNYTAGTIMFSSNGNTMAGGTEENYYYRFNGIFYRFRIAKGTGSSSFPKLTIATSEDAEHWTWDNWNFAYNGKADYMLCREGNQIFVLMVIQNPTTSAYSYKRHILEGVLTGYDLWLKTGVIDIPDGVEIGENGGILHLPIPWGKTYGEVINSVPGLTEGDDLAGNTFLTLDSELAVEGQVDQIATNEPTVSNNPSDYQTPGLSSVFPFCIPFDIYNFFECLAADPVAPSFTWRFYVPNICDESIEIDLSEFDTAAQILRTMELLAFCVGLAFVTRKIIRG